VSELIANLKATSESVRLQAIDALAQKKAVAAVPALTDLLSDPAAVVRAHAAQALGEIGAPAAPAVEPLARAIADQDPLVRRQAAGAIRKIRPGPKVMLPILSKLLEDSDPQVRIRVLHALAEMGKDALPGLLKALDSEQGAYWACLVISQIGPEAKEAVPALAKLISDKRPDVRREAILALAEIGEGSAPAAPQLAAAIDDELTRLPAIYALGRIGKLPPEAEAKVRGYSKSKDRLLGTVSMWTLARVHSGDKQLLQEAATTLVEGLKSEDAQVRKAAARALGTLQPGPEVLLPIMEKALAGADEKIVVDALDALASLGSQAVPRLIAAMKHQRVRPRVVYILGQIGPDAAPATPALAECLADKNDAVRREAAMALAKIGPGAKDAAEALAKALDDPEPAVAYGAAFALGKIGPSAAAAKPRLLKAIKSDDPSLALIAAWTLVQIHPTCKECTAAAMPLLTQGLKDSDARFRLGAVEALKSLGTRAKAAKPAIEALLHDENPQVREAASQALQAIAE
jgi:HEAT repeat protein